MLVKDDWASNVLSTICLAMWYHMHGQYEPILCGYVVCLFRVPNLPDQLWLLLVK